MTETSEPSSQNALQQGVIALLKDAANRYLESISAPAEVGEAELEVELQVPRKAEHGDWATNIAMKLAKTLKSKPLDIANGIVQQIGANDLIDPPEVAPPGFINLRLSTGAVRRTVEQVLIQKESYGTSNHFAGQRALVEFVSANPTGPLHVGHGRNAIVGDTLARLFKSAGYEVEREYYYNDAGVQMELLGRSLQIRYLQRCGRDLPFPDEGYKGDYMKEIADALHAEVGESRTDEQDIYYFTRYAADTIMKSIKADLDVLGIGFDHYFLESSLHRDGRVEGVIETLKARGKIYEQEGALWLRSTEFGDEKDRVIRKSDGKTTYLTPDIAYHEDKYNRGYDKIVNILGGDHHGYVIRLKAALNALGHDPEKLHCVLIQMVSVKEGGEARKLSTRAGDFVALKTIMDELGPELTRFFYLLRAADSQMVFDIDLARQQSMDNPYWYIQYAHARCCSLLAKAEEKQIAWNESPGAPFKAELLMAPEERAIIFQIGRLPSVVVDASAHNEPLPMTTYLRELATAFHSYFTAGNRDAGLRCIQPEQPELTQARLTLIVALKQTLANGLKLLGLTPIDRL